MLSLAYVRQRQLRTTFKRSTDSQPLTLAAMDFMKVACFVVVGLCCVSCAVEETVKETVQEDVHGEHNSLEKVHEVFEDIEKHVEGLSFDSATTTTSCRPSRRSSKTKLFVLRIDFPRMAHC